MAWVSAKGVRGVLKTGALKHCLMPERRISATWSEINSRLIQLWGKKGYNYKPEESLILTLGCGRYLSPNMANETFKHLSVPANDPLKLK